MIISCASASLQLKGPVWSLGSQYINKLPLRGDVIDSVYASRGTRFIEAKERSKHNEIWRKKNLSGAGDPKRWNRNGRHLLFLDVMNLKQEMKPSGLLSNIADRLAFVEYMCVWTSHVH